MTLGLRGLPVLLAAHHPTHPKQTHVLQYRNTPLISTSRMAACTRGTLVISEPSPTSTRVPPEQVAWGGSKNKKTRKIRKCRLPTQNNTVITQLSSDSIRWVSKTSREHDSFYTAELFHSVTKQDSSKVNIIFFKDPEIIHFSSVLLEDQAQREHLPLFTKS